MPFERQYFSGGANSIRAWQVKDLGPGSYVDPEKTAYPIQTGDVKLEANMEYRFKLFWKLEVLTRIYLEESYLRWAGFLIHKPRNLYNFIQAQTYQDYAESV